MSAISQPAAALGDRGAILLSGLCLVHCLFLPIMAALLPWLAWLGGNETWVHRGLLLTIVPISLLALASGWRRHHDRRVLLLGLAALGLLSCAALAGTALPRPWLETALTVMGSVALTISHLLNLRALDRCHPAA
ncbi:MerC domain-containing protein [Panacagrimonas sp.]|uniref:MerC domain-containing protein n=1 Tax=Panacagrimonas sp. TaxID=2480088 RepID=UPI003B52908A